MLIVSTSGSCPLDSVNIEGRCFQAFQTSMDYSAAEDYCIGIGSTLAKVHDCNIMTGLTQYLDTQGNLLFFEFLSLNI